MKIKLLSLSLLALLTLTAGSASAAAATITNVQLGEILVGETNVTNNLTILAQHEAYLANSQVQQQGGNVRLSAEISAVHVLQTIVPAEQNLLLLYEQARITPMVATENQLIQHLNQLLQQKELLESLYASGRPNKQVITSTLINILSIDHNIASDLLQKESLILETLPADISVQINQQYTLWTQVIRDTQIQEQLSFQ